MNDNQQTFVISSIEDGVKLVRNFRNVAVLGGRETLFFDIQRFGKFLNLAKAVKNPRVSLITVNGAVYSKWVIILNKQGSNV